MHKYVCVIQGFYFLLTGLWPLISVKTFQKVTGPKTDLWLVKTIAILVVVVGSVLVLAGFREAVSLEIRILAIESALGLSAVEMYYVMTQRISAIYLLDTFVEVAFAVFWVLSAFI